MVTEKLGCLHTSFEQFPQYQHRHHVFLSTSIVCNGLAPVHPARVIAAKLTTWLKPFVYWQARNFTVEKTMCAISLSPARRGFLATLAVLPLPAHPALLGDTLPRQPSMQGASPTDTTEKAAIRAFYVRI